MLFLTHHKNNKVIDVRTISITRPDDWHIHFRDTNLLQHTVNATATHFARGLAMPNLIEPLVTIESILAYRQRIIDACESAFTPYMTLYLNDAVTTSTMEQIKAYPCILGAKLYPAGTTTHSDQGARSIQLLYPMLEIMQANDLVLQIHGEVVHGDIFDRERLFIEQHLRSLTQDFPKLRIVLEHISSQSAVDFVKQSGPNVSATITPHHLLYNRNQLLGRGLKPHYYCLPILKREQDQRALQEAATSGNPKFFAGTDSAPHAVHTKESACGCAGIYSAPYAVAIYAQVFDELNQLERLNKFLGHFGAEFYKLAVSNESLELVQSRQQVPNYLPLGDHHVVPIAAGENLQWSIYEAH